MLSSIILSMAISVTPTPIADTHNLDIQEIGRSRGTLRIDNENALTVEKTGRSRGTLRI